MKKLTNFVLSVFFGAPALITLVVGAIFLSPAYARQGSTSSAQQVAASSAAQDSSATSTPAAKATSETKPAPSTTKPKPSATTPATKSTATAASQADAPAKASAAPAAQAGATKTRPAAAKTTKPGASKTATAKTPATLALNTPTDKQSYAIGINVGKGLNQNLKQSGVDIDPAILTRAIKDVLSGGKQLMTDQEAQETLKALQAGMRNAQEEKTKQLAEANKKEGDEFLAANKTKEGVTTLPDGLQYKILQEGTGPKPAASDSVTVNYRGTLVNGTEFDSSYNRGQPVTLLYGHDAGYQNKSNSSPSSPNRPRPRPLLRQPPIPRPRLHRRMPRPHQTLLHPQSQRRQPLSPIRLLRQHRSRQRPRNSFATKRSLKKNLLQRKPSRARPFRFPA